MSSEWLSMTRAIGLAAYGISLLSCSIQWARRSQRDESSHLFALLAGIQLAMLLDMAFDWRWKLHAYLMRMAMAQGVYGERRAPQLQALVILAVILLLCCSAILYRLRRRTGHRTSLRPGLALASIGTMLSLGLWCSEALSYHFLDQVLYRMVGRAMLVSFLWCGLAALTSLGAWTADRSYRKR
jgi:hypothetical protein